MPNAYIPRDRVHAWSDDIADNLDDHQPSLQRLLKDQRRISRFVEENAQSMDPSTVGIALYLIGVIVRIFDLAGGRLKSATWEQVRDAERRVQGAVEQLLPVDEKLPERARAVTWRAQPHILDEALLALFEQEPDEDQPDLDKAEAFKTYLLMWVATEALDANWKPPKGFEGQTEYSYVHIEPRKRDKASEE